MEKGGSMKLIGRMDGLQVLKGGQGKATIFFDKEMMPKALAVNESEIAINQNIEQAIVNDPLETVLQNLINYQEMNLTATIAAYEELKARGAQVEPLNNNKPGDSEPVAGGGE